MIILHPLYVTQITHVGSPVSNKTGTFLQINKFGWLTEQTRTQEKLPNGDDENSIA